MGEEGCINIPPVADIHYLSYQSKSERLIWQVGPNRKTLVINVDDRGVLFDLGLDAAEGCSTYNCLLAWVISFSCPCLYSVVMWFKLPVLIGTSLP